MNMKAHLGVYSMEAYKVLRQATNWYLNTIFSHYRFCVEPDNEVAFIEDVESDPAVARRRLANALLDYTNGNPMILRSPADEERAKAGCLRAILLGEDSEAKATFPSMYDELKGKPLNPIQAETMSLLMREVVATEMKIDEVLIDGGLARGGEIGELEMKKNELLKQIELMSGMNNKVRFRRFSGGYVMELAF